jgi:drug/metabolite transporter (DMT)-like permease
MATFASAVGCAAIGAVVGDLDLTPSWAAIGWLILLALSSQVVGWLLISTSLPRLPAVVTSILLTFQPVCAVVFAALIVDESPSLVQLGGAACILAGLLTATIGRREAPVAAEPELAG